jgi:RNA polymerase sigma-70 factor (family 1)
MAITKPTSDCELVAKLRKGDINAFDQIFNKYGGRLFGFAFNYLKSKEEAEGLVQDVFLKIWENRKSLKAESSLKSYLFTIAYHDICGYFRKKKMHDKCNVEIGLTSNKTVNPEEQLDYKSTLEQIDQLIEKLPEKQRVIFMKSRKEGKSTKEIADEMNLAPGTVDNQISAALKILRKKMSANRFAILLFFTFFIQ